MTTLREKLRQLGRLFTSSGQMPANPAEQKSALDAHSLQNLMQLVGNTHEEMYSCDETFELLDEYVELATTQEDMAMLMPFVKRHLDMCPDCHERYDVLLTILENDPSV